MPFSRQASERTGHLEQALKRILGLSHLYQRSLTAVTNSKMRDILEDLAEEKRKQAQILEMAISKQGGDAKGVRIPLDHPIGSHRELLPRIFQEEEALSLWCRSQISSAQKEEIKAMFQTLLKEEDHHLQMIKDLYRDLTHC